jgi:hypothetical protein
MQTTKIAVFAQKFEPKLGEFCIFLSNSSVQVASPVGARHIAPSTGIGPSPPSAMGL